MYKKVIKNSVYVLLGIVGAWFVIVRPFIYHRWLLNKYPRYTIGVVVDKKAPANGDVDVMMKYTVHGKSYETFAGTGNFDHKVNIGDRFMIRYCEIKPQVNSILTDHPVVDSIVPPQEGWRSVHQY